MHFLENFLELKWINNRLRLAGMLPEAATLQARVYRSIAAFFTAAGYQTDTKASGLWVPGRIEVLGKHTDYAGGESLLVASERGFAP